MIKSGKITEGGKVALPDTFLCDINLSREVDVYFGDVHGVVIIVAKDAKLSGDNKERIRILTEVK